MNKFDKKWLFFLLFAAFATAYSGTITREYHETHEFDGEKVTVETVNGKIFIETWQQDAVDVYAEIEVRSTSKSEAREFMDDVEIIVRRRGDDLDIRVEKPHDKSSGIWDWFSGDKPNLTVNFSIKVPEQMDIEASSVNGAIDVLGIEGRAFLSTTNGKILAEEIAGSVEAHTTNGSIFVDIRTADLKDDVDLNTVNGSIKLALEENVKADIDISTVNGSINTDFPLEVHGKWGPKNVSGEINGGGAHIELETVNGTVSLMQR
ncbi:hypothetical protein EH223_13095 [candidate division KSB1 bacterium]|nr:DUF4097 family beta strand repeat protein [candidate division KSB1 bacterium]RQW02174.1 MAG: hypothetical protein EH223_13095 [candidate division KSB1 bacterium]